MKLLRATFKAEAEKGGGGVRALLPTQDVANGH